MLFHDSSEGKAARFAKSEHGMRVKAVYGGWIEQGMDNTFFSYPLNILQLA